MTTGTNPTLHYPRPPFVEQPQQAPGLASEMKPIPDHGETSYIGSGKLEGKKPSSPAVTLVSGARWPSLMRVKVLTSRLATFLRKSPTQRR